VVEASAGNGCEQSVRTLKMSRLLTLSHGNVVLRCAGSQSRCERSFVHLDVDSGSSP
jgi:hypothetical protein